MHFLCDFGYKTKNDIMMSNFRPMRRQRQQLSMEESISILQRATSGTLALLGDNDIPAGVFGADSSYPSLGYARPIEVKVNEMDYEAAISILAASSKAE